MFRRNRLIGIGLAAVLGLGMLAMPNQASAQLFRHRSRTHSEDSSRNNAIALGAAGLILLNSHESTLGTVALAGAALELGQMQHDIDNRHDRYGYSYNNRYYGRRGDGDRDDRYYGNNGYAYGRGNDRYYGNNGNGYGYGYGRTRGDGDYDRDDRARNNRRRGTSWYDAVTGNNRRDRDDRNRNRDRDRDRDRDGDRDRG